MWIAINKTMEKEKMTETTTIEITMETYNRLHSVKQQVAKILRKKSISFDTLFKLFFIMQPIETTLQDLILEENPSINFDKRRKKYG